MISALLKFDISPLAVAATALGPLLSPGAIAGIAIGATIGLVAIVVFIVVLIVAIFFCGAHVGGNIIYLSEALLSNNINSFFQTLKDNSRLPVAFMPSELAWNTDLATGTS